MASLENNATDVLDDDNDDDEEDVNVVLCSACDDRRANDERRIAGSSEHLIIFLIKISKPSCHRFVHRVAAATGPPPIARASKTDLILTITPVCQ